MIADLTKSKIIFVKSADRRAGLDPELASSFLLAKRFGVDQGDKVRACDDYQRSQGNRAAGFSRKAQLPSIDTFCALCRLVS